MTIAETTSTPTAALQTMLEEVVNGLSGEQKTLPSKYFYDDRGSKLFDEICELDEYYVTRTESALMKRWVGDMARTLGPEVLLVEYGSGSSLKTRLLLRNLIEPVGYVPIDISGEYLSQVAINLQVEFPEIDIIPVVADFTEQFDVPWQSADAQRKVVYFPGSTIGNFQRQEAKALLRKMTVDAGTNGGVLIGVDLDKDREVLRAAYNDSKGVTADFNLNVLRRINGELGGTFDLNKFQHIAIFNEELSCIEMHLVSTENQTAKVCEYAFEFSESETILTEYSHKYRVNDFKAMASEVGLEGKNLWTDDNEMFAVMYLEQR